MFSAPALIGLLVFVAIPIVIAAWVSFRDWSGLVSPSHTEYIGFENYNDLLFQDGVRRTDFALSIRNNFYYVLFVVPMQTTLAFVLAVILNNRFLKGKGFFRTSYYFPSITSSIAVTLIFVFLFQTSGAINAILPFETINWLSNANGLFHNALGLIGIEEPPVWMIENEFMGVTYLAMDRRPQRGHVRHHPSRHLDLDRYLHAHLPRRAPVDPRVGGGGGQGRRRFDVPDLLARHCPADEADHLLRGHHRAHCHLAGVRPDLRHQLRWSAEDDDHSRPSSSTSSRSATPRPPWPRPSPSCCWS